MSDVGLRSIHIHVEYKPTNLGQPNTSMTLPAVAVVDVTTPVSTGVTRMSSTVTRVSQRMLNRTRTSKFMQRTPAQPTTTLQSLSPKTPRRSLSHVPSSRPCARQNGREREQEKGTRPSHPGCDSRDSSNSFACRDRHLWGYLLYASARPTALFGCSSIPYPQNSALAVCPSKLLERSANCRTTLCGSSPAAFLPPSSSRAPALSSVRPMDQQALSSKRFPEPPGFTTRAAPQSTPRFGEISAA